jgi:hypothetical protein
MVGSRRSTGYSMNVRLFLIFCLNFAGMTVIGWLLYLFFKFMLRVAQHFLSVDLMNEFDKTAMATIAVFVFVILMAVVARRSKK